jgi:hypothetical protein
VSVEKESGGGEFKQCSMCGRVWHSRSEFLADPEIKLVGYQAFHPDPVLGLFLLNHLACNTTLAIKAGEFEDLYEGPIYSDRLTGSEACPDYCNSTDELRPCPNKCECAFVREILQVVKGWPKEAQP